MGAAVVVGAVVVGGVGNLGAADTDGGGVGE